MEKTQATHPLQLVHLDYLMIEVTDSRKDVHMLIITDHIMRYTQALVTSSHTARHTVQALWDQFIVHYGLQFQRVTSFKNCASCQKYRNYILALTIQKEMDNVNSLIIH